MTDPTQDEAVVLRMIGLGEQLDAANATARAIVGPEQRTAPNVLAAARRLFAAGRLDDVSPCRHFDPTAVAWWSPHAPALLGCRPCHDEAAANRGGRCDLCRRSARLRSVLHLVAASPPARIDQHHVGARPPVIVDFRLCEPCRTDNPTRPGRKRKRR